MAKLIMRLTCSFGLLALVGLTGAARQRRRTISP